MKVWKKESIKERFIHIKALACENFAAKAVQQLDDFQEREKRSEKF